MSDSFEDKLRRSLSARATDVTPDPALFARVQSRIRRGRTFRLALAGAVGALALGGAAIAAPGLMDRRVELEPGPVTTAPASEATPTAVATATEAPVVDAPPPFVFTDGGSAQLGDGGSILWGTDGGTMQSVAARPGSTALGTTVAVAEGGECAVVRYGAGGMQPAGVEEGPAPAPGTDVPVQDGCVATPVFSPDGASLAWVAATDDGWTIQTIDWTDEGPGENDASFGLPWPSDQPVDLQEWVWDEQTATGAKGHLVVRTQRQGAWMLLRIPVERQGDGSLAVVLDAAPVESDEGVPVAFASAGEDVSYTMELDFAADGPRTGFIVWRKGDEVHGGFAVPQELYSEPDFNVADVWMTASPDAVLFGNAATGEAWWIRFPNNGDGASDGPHPGARRANGDNGPIFWADLLVEPSAARPGGDPTEVPRERTAQVEVQVHFTQEGSECGEDIAAYPRMVRGPGVLRGALEELLEGPERQELAAGASSIFSDATSGALNDITLGDNGVAVVDFTTDFTEAVISASCASSGAFAQLDATARQFPSVSEVVYSLNGSIARFYAAYEAVPPPHRPDIPLPVTRTQWAIYDALIAARQDDDYDELASLIDRDTFSCSLSDQNEDCVALWQKQEAEGGDPLGALTEILQGEAAQVDGAQMWVLPAEWAEPNTAYTGPRVGIDADGTWRYYVQQGG